MKTMKNQKPKKKKKKKNIPILLLKLKITSQRKQREKIQLTSKGHTNSDAIAFVKGFRKPLFFFFYLSVIPTKIPTLQNCKL